MSEREVQAILARERRTRGEPEEGTYRDLQERAKGLGIPATGSAKELTKAIEKAEEKRAAAQDVGSSGA
jgi:hypothetical protein